MKGNFNYHKSWYLSSFKTWRLIIFSADHAGGLSSCEDFPPDSCTSEYKNLRAEPQQRFLILFWDCGTRNMIPFCCAHLTRIRKFSLQTHLKLPRFLVFDSADHQLLFLEVRGQTHSVTCVWQRASFTHCRLSVQSEGNEVLIQACRSTASGHGLLCNTLLNMLKCFFVYVHDFVPDFHISLARPRSAGLSYSCLSDLVQVPSPDFTSSLPPFYDTLPLSFFFMWHFLAFIVNSEVKRWTGNGRVGCITHNKDCQLDWNRRSWGYMACAVAIWLPRHSALPLSVLLLSKTIILCP